MITFKALNSALWFTTTVFSWGRWVMFGNPETQELQLAKQNKQRLDRIENKIDQLWAIESGLVKPAPYTEPFTNIDENLINCKEHELP